MLWATSHPQTCCSAFFEVNKSERVEPAKSTKTFATAVTTVSVTPVLVDEATHLVATSEGLGGGPSPVGHQGVPCSSTVSVAEPTPTLCDGNELPRLKDIPGAEGAESSLEASSAPQEKQEGGKSVVPEVQPDTEPFEGAAAPRQVGSEGPEPQLESQRRQGEWVTGTVAVFEPRDVSDLDGGLACSFSVTPS